MFISDLKKEFYNRLLGKRILVIVNYDVDAICASKILQALLKYDHIVYTVVPVLGVAGVRRAFNAHREHVKNVLLINCGGSLDIVALLLPSDDCTIYICDVHRPYDVCNIYSDRQVCFKPYYLTLYLFKLCKSRFISIHYRLGLYFGRAVSG